MFDLELGILGVLGSIFLKICLWVLVGVVATILLLLLMAGAGIIKEIIDYGKNRRS